MRYRTGDVNAACIDCGELNALHQKFIVMGGYWLWKNQRKGKTWKNWPYKGWRFDRAHGPYIFITFYWSSIYWPTCTSTFLVVNDFLEHHVRSEAFDKDCARGSKEIPLKDDLPYEECNASDHAGSCQPLQQVLFIRSLPAWGLPIPFRYPRSHTLGSQVDLPDIQGRLPSALRTIRSDTL